jgi:polysaccharide pyruvyl transferase WcaK-like protein
MKILLTGAFNSLNKGDEARVKSTIQALKRIDPDINCAFLSYNIDIDLIKYRHYNLTILRAPWYKKFDSKFKILLYVALKGLFILFRSSIYRIFNKLFGSKIGDEFEQYDIFMDLSGESLSDYFGQIALLFCLYPILLGIILNKKVIIYAQSIGPFDNRLGRLISKFILNKVYLITVRDKKSLEYLQKYGINNPRIYLTADPAFLLEPVSDERVAEILGKEGISKKNKCLIGMSLSRGSFKRGISDSKSIDQKYQDFIEVISKTIDYLIEKLDGKVIFIPHVLIPSEDDRVVFKEIYQKVKNKNDFKIIEGDYSCEELRGIIGQCDLFIGSRMHANISAFCMNVPTIGIAYSHKMPSLFEILGQEKYCIDVTTITFDEILSKINEALYSKEKIKEELRPKISQMQRLALLNAELVRDI